MLGTFMVIGDSILAPSISGMIAGIAVVTLVFLFNFQRFGTSKVGYTFAPILSTTGGKTLFADVGNFSVRSIQISMCSMVYPALILAYMGQAAYLISKSYVLADVCCFHSGCSNCDSGNDFGDILDCATITLPRMLPSRQSCPHICRS